MTDSSAREDLIRNNDCRVASILLAPGECSRWHQHSRLTENIFCLIGLIDVETDSDTHRLHPGERCQLKPLQRHRLVNPGTRASRYLLVQSGSYDFITDASNATLSPQWRASSP